MVTSRPTLGAGGPVKRSSCGGGHRSGATAGSFGRSPAEGAQQSISYHAFRVLLHRSACSTLYMTAEDEELRVVSARREVEASADRISS